MKDKTARLLLFLKTAGVCSGSSLFIAYHVNKTYNSLHKIVNPSVLEREKHQPEFIYVDDPSYKNALKVEERKQLQASGLARVWKSFKYSFALKLIWLCHHGNKEQRDIAIQQLAAFKNNKIWDCCKIAQILDKDTAVLLARTKGADLRYFLPPPIHIRREAMTSKLLSYKFRDLITAVQQVKPHHCIQYFINKYFIDVQQHTMESVEADSIPSKPDNMNDRDLCILCLEAIYHHLSLFNVPNYEDDKSLKTLVNLGLLSLLTEAMLRYPNDMEVDFAVVKILSVLSVHTNLLKDFFQLGLIRELSRLLRSDKVNLATSAAVCLANLSGEYCYRPGLYLLHPIYRTTTPQSCDILLVHGLRGGVFVTWRQRDRKCARPVGTIEVTMSNSDCVDSGRCSEKKDSLNKTYMDPDAQEVMDDYLESEDEATLSDMEVILHDVPIEALREPQTNDTYLALKKRIAMMEEEEDKCNYTFCWPKDWLPRDCKNLRILGVNYLSSISEWVEKCPLQTASIESRASDIVPTLVDADVGKNNVPVVWLGHSMGGLIVKQSLVDVAKSNEHSLKNLAKNTKSVLFFSTPHRGSSLAMMSRAAAAVVWPSHDVKQLQVNSPTLLKLHQDFTDLTNLYEWEIISFTEALPTLVTALKFPLNFVESFSADFGHGVFYQLPLDHLSICKPATRQSILYTTVLDAVLRACSQENVKQQKDAWLFINELYNQFKVKFKEVKQLAGKSQDNESVQTSEKLILNFYDDYFVE